MTQATVPLTRRAFGQTLRRDTLVGAAADRVLHLVARSSSTRPGPRSRTPTTRFGPYLSPFYSPELFGDSPHAWFGPKPGWWPGWLPFSPALLILWVPAGFRFTCYYYRGAYYKAFWADPPACAVGEPRKTYLGERSFPLILQNVHRYFLYLALVFLVILALRRLEGDVVRRPADGRTRSASASARWCWPSTSCCSAATPSAATRCATWSAACSIELVQEARFASSAVRLRRAASTAATCCGPGAASSRSAFADLYVRLCSMGIWHRLEDLLMAEVRDARARRPGHRRRRRRPARRHRGRRRAGVTVGLVCKSLLGKAHTVMAEGGMAAALANVDDRDNWQVHFADTMRGGQYVNNWRMAELHAKEAPDRVRELEAWGAVFDRTKDGRILQRNFGGHRYPRLAHVGDRTGLEMIRTLQDHGIHQGIDVHMECTVVTPAQGRRPRRRRVRLRPRARPLPASSRPRPSCSPPAASAAPSRSPATAGSTPATATRWPTTPAPSCMDMEFVQFHPTGMVWPPSVRGILVTEGVRGEGGVLRNNEGKRFMFDDIPEQLQEPDRRQRRGGLALRQGDKNARRPPELLTRDHVARCIIREVQGGPRQPARRRVPRHRLDQGEAPQRRRAHQEEAAEHVPPVQAAGRHRHHQGADGSRARPRTTSWAASASTATRRCPTVPGLFAAGEVRRRAARRQPAGRQLALRPAGLRQARRRVRREVRQGARRGGDRRRRSRRRGASRRWRRSSAAAAESPYQVQHDLQDMMQDLVGIVRSEDEMQRGARRHRRAQGSAPRRVGVARQPRVQPRLAHRARPAEPADRLRGDRRARRSSARRAAAATSATTSRRRTPEFGKFNIVVRARARTARCSSRREPIPPMPRRTQADHRGE